MEKILSELTDIKFQLEKIKEILDELNDSKHSDDHLKNIADVVKSGINGGMKFQIDNLRKAIQVDDLDSHTPREASATYIPREQRIEEIKKKAIIYGGIFCGGLLTAFLGGYLALSPLEKKIGEKYTFGTLLIKAWPKLTPIEQKRLKGLF